MRLRMNWRPANLNERLDFVGVTRWQLIMSLVKFQDNEILVDWYYGRSVNAILSVLHDIDLFREE